MKDLAKLKGKMSETGLSSVVGIKVSPSTLQMLLECESKIIDYCRLCHLGHMFLLLDQIGSLSISRHLSTSTSLNMCDFGRFDFVMCEMGEPCGATTNSRLAQHWPSPTRFGSVQTEGPVMLGTQSFLGTREAKVC